MATLMLPSIIVIGEFHWVDVFVHWNYGTWQTNTKEFSTLSILTIWIFRFLLICLNKNALAERNTNKIYFFSFCLFYCYRFVLRSYGISGLQKYIRHHIELAKRFEQHVLKDKRFEICNQVKVSKCLINFIKFF